MRATNAFLIPGHVYSPSNAKHIELAKWEDDLEDFLLISFRDNKRRDSE